MVVSLLFIGSSVDVGFKVSAAESLLQGARGGKSGRIGEREKERETEREERRRRSRKGNERGELDSVRERH